MLAEYESFLVDESGLVSLDVGFKVVIMIFCVEGGHQNLDVSVD